MAGTITPICLCDEPLLIRASFATYRACPARVHWGRNDASVAHSAEYFLGGAPAIGTCSGRHWEVRFHATSYWSSYSSFSLGKTGSFLVPRLDRLMHYIQFPG